MNSPKTMVGIRGATTTVDNSRSSILERTAELFDAIVKDNQLAPEDVAAVIFTTTPDLNQEFPAYAIRRKKNWSNTALLGSVEMAHPEGTPFCIRMLILANRAVDGPPPVFKYLHNAANLREAKDEI